MENKNIIPALISICFYIQGVQTQKALYYARKCRKTAELKMLLRKIHQADEKFKKEAMYILQMSQIQNWN